MLGVMKMKKMIMMDLDGTLLETPGSMLLPAFVSKITALTNRGWMFSVNSARPYDSLKRFLAPLEGRTLFICNDGAQIMFKNCVVYKAPIAVPTAREVCSLALRAGITVSVALREQSVPADLPTVQRAGFFGEDVYKIILIKNSRDRAAAETVKRAALSGGLKLCYEDLDYTEFSRADVNKGTACEFVMKKYDLQGGIYAFGDSKFDVPMFEKATHSFVMKNGKLQWPGAVVVENAQQYVLNNL